MSVIELNQYSPPPLFDVNPVEPDAGAAQPGASGSFDDYLQRAQTSSAGDNPASDSSRDAGQPPLRRTDESKSTAAPPNDPNNNEQNSDHVSGKEPAGSDSRPQPESRPPENKNKPVEQDKTGSPTGKKEKDDKKDESSNSDSATIDKNQDNQRGAQISAAAGDAKNGLQLEGGGDTSIQAETQAIPNPIAAASKDAKMKNAADSGPLAMAESAASDVIEISAAQGAALPVSAPGKQKASEMTGLEGTENAGQPAAAQAVATAAAAGENAIFADKASKGIRSPLRDAEANAADQNGKTQFLAGPAANATVSPSVGQNAPAGAAALNIATLPPAVNPPLMPAKLVKDKTDRTTSDKPADAAPADKAADPLNALQRAGLSGSKTTASQQGGTDESGSNLGGVRFVQRVEQAFAAMSDRGGAVRIKLSPPELGSLSVEISVNKGVMKAHLETETKEAKNLLLENLPALRDRLAQQNIKIQKFDVDLRDPSSGGTSQQSADQAETRSGGGGYRASRPQNPENNAAAATTQTSNILRHNGQLNVIV